MFFGSGGGGARNSIRSRVALMRWRSASRASASASARRRRAAGTSSVPLRPRSLSAMPMFGLSAPAGSVNSASSRVEMRCASPRSSRCCVSPISRSRTRLRSVPTAATAAAEATARAPAASATPAAARALARLADVQLAALQLVAVQLGDRPLSLARRAHLDEAEAARPSGGAIGDHGGRLAGPGLREERLEIRTRRVEGKIAHEQLLPHVSLLASGRPLTFLGCLGEKPVATRARRADHAQTREEGRVAPMPTPGKLAALAEASLAGAEPAPIAAGAAERAAVAAAEPLEIESLGRRRAHHAHRSWRPRRRLVVGVVHTQAPAAQLEGVEAPDGVGRAGRVRELSEREA